MFNGSGIYTLPGPQLASGETVSATENNQFRNDVADAFNDVLCRDGQSLPTADLPMGGFKLTGLPAGTANGDSVRYEQATSDVAITGGAISGASITSSSVNITGGTISGVDFASSNVDITGGTITGVTLEVPWETPGTIGSTTPNTGNFTNLTAALTKSTSYQETKQEIAAADIDLSTANYFSKTLTGAISFTVSNVPSTGTVASFILDLTNAGTYIITWWANVKWAAGGAPVLTEVGRDVLGFYTYDNGSTWTGFLLARDVK